MKFFLKKVLVLGVLASLSTLQLAQAETVRVYAAASLTNAIDEIAKNYQNNSKNTVKTSYAGSSTLAKQIEAGAPANVFLSADEQWMDYVQNRNLVKAQDRINLLGNQLVLISPVNQNVQVRMNPNFNLSQAFKGKLCTGDTNSVPVGKYAKQALTQLGWWSSIQSRLVETQDVRAALNFVARGECELGIVYATDAKIEPKVKVVATFPANTHPAIIYPAAIVKTSPEAVQFYQYLQTPQATAVFKRYGFSVLAAKP